MACIRSPWPVDWEHPKTPQEGRDFTALIATLRQAMPADRYLITCALGPGRWSVGDIDLPKVAEYIDFINVMCYDFSGPWAPNCGYHSQLYDPAFPNNPTKGLSCQTAVNYYRGQKVPPEKIVVGIPAYGRSFLGASKPGDAYSGTGGSDGAFDYHQLPRPGTKEMVDSVAGAAYCVGSDGGFVVRVSESPAHELLTNTSATTILTL